MHVSLCVKWWVNVCQILTTCHLHICLYVCLYSWPTVRVRGGSELSLHPWRLQYYFCWLLCNLEAGLWGWPTWCTAVDTRQEHTWHCVLSGVRGRGSIGRQICFDVVFMCIGSRMQIYSMEWWIKQPSHTHMLPMPAVCHPYQLGLEDQRQWSSSSRCVAWYVLPL